MDAHRTVLSPGSIAVYSGQYSGRVDGRASHNEGLPPSVADKDNRRFDNPIDPGDCAEVDSLPTRAPVGKHACTMRASNLEEPLVATNKKTARRRSLYSRFALDQAANAALLRRR
jgi:hypothetical protein